MAKESGFINDISTPDLLQFSTQGLQDFRLLYESTEGFMRVFTARRAGKIFAVKTLRDIYRNDFAAEAYLQKEFEVAISIDSPFVAKTYDLQEIPGFGKAIVEEFCAGVSLQQLIDSDSKLTEADMNAIISGLLRGIDDIHTAGVIHRDIKPSNIIYNLNTRSLKIIDFGCANSENFEIFSAPAGTPDFTPYVANPHKSPDINHDLYAAGITLTKLTPLLPAKLQHSVTALASQLVEKKLHSGHDAITFFEKHSSRKLLSMRVSLFAILLILIAGIAPLYFYLTQPESGTTEPAIEVAQSGHEHEEASTIPAEDHDASKVAGVTEAVEIKSKPTMPEPTKSESGVQEMAINEPVNSESVKNEYGVSLAEAKYASNFSKNSNDKAVIDATDNIVKGLMEQYNEAIINHDEKQLASVRERYHSFEYISAAVLSELGAKINSMDKQRALGLIRERLKLHHTTFIII